jgi:hypothetical protein
MSTKKKATKSKAPAKKKAPLKRVKTPALFEGVLPDSIPALDRQCQKLIEARADTGKARLNEKDVQGKLIEMMHDEKIPSYRHEASGKVFNIDEKESVHYKSAPKDDPKKKSRTDTRVGNEINPGMEAEDAGKPIGSDLDDDEKADAEDSDAKAE